ncbi:MAG: o-succinylbenzoate--CoA ligase [Nocardioidaceae bacterium]
MVAAHARGDLLQLRTSGTSGGVRSVLRTTDSWVRSFPAVSALLELTASAQLWVPGPLSTTMNLFSAVHAAFAGATLVDSPDRASHAVLTPATLSRLVGDLRPGLHVLVAGDRLEPVLHDRASAAGLRVSHYYGAAELSFVAWGAHAEDLRPFPGVEVVSREGVLWVRSPYLCEGYVGPPGPLTTDSAGFATVGDRGSHDDGRVRVTGRGTEAVTTGGATVLVADVEAALRPSTEGELAIVGIPHPDLGAVLGCVLTSPSCFQAVREAARALPPEHRPRRWFHLARLPVTHAGKLDRPALQDILVSSTEGVRRLA